MAEVVVQDLGSRVQDVGFREAGASVSEALRDL